ncbi:MAG: hypothetical protein KAT16_04795 [Candidatus Heimdallarchaeota archaeon]|nr:hypothetical protein [Candidatus Heimdallarchaeota archaeon]
MVNDQLTVNVYGATWCSDCCRTKKYLGEQRIHYNWYDIEIPGTEGEKALQFVYDANLELSGKPKRKIPAVEVTFSYPRKKIQMGEKKKL